MKIILSRFFPLNSICDVDAYLKAYDFYCFDRDIGGQDPSAFDRDVVIFDAEDARIGHAHILIRLAGEDNYSLIGCRSDFCSAALDGEPYPLHGDAFRRYHCVRTEDRYEAEVERLNAEAQRRIDAIRSDAAEREAAVTEGLTMRLNRLAEEFAADLAAESTQDQD